MTLPSRAVATGALGALGLALLACALLFAGLGRVAVEDGDEPKAPVVARTMVDTGDWLAPRWNGALRLEKPPLYPWLVALGLRSPGALDEVRARRPAAIAAAVGVAAAVALGWRAAGPTAGLVAGLVLLTSPMWVLYARQALVDSTASSLNALATLGFAFALPPAGRRWAGLLGFAAVGAGLVAKGPVALLPLVGLATLAAVRWDAAVLRAVPWGWGSLLAAAIGLPWFVLIAREHGPLLLETARAQVADRALAGGGVHPRPALWYLLVLPANFFPWSLFLPAAVRDLAARAPAAAPDGSLRRGPTSLGLAAATAASTLLAFCAVRGKMAYYLLPAYPTLAVLVGASWARGLARRDAGASQAPFARAAALSVGALALVLAPLAVVLFPLLGEDGWGTVALAGVAAATGGWLLVRAGGTVRDRLAGTGLVATAVCGALVSAVAPVMDRYRSIRPLAAAVSPVLAGRPLVVVEGMPLPTALHFYEPRLPTVRVIRLDEVQGAVAGARALALVPAAEAERLPCRASGGCEVLRVVRYRHRDVAVVGAPPAADGLASTPAEPAAGRYR